MITCVSCHKDTTRFERGRKKCRDCREADRTKPGNSRSPERTLRYRLDYLYGITPEKYDEMLVAQGGLCKICRGSDNGPWGKLAVDHCHKTGRVRGLLCAKCNKGLGQFNDNPELIRLAAAYLDII